MRDKVFPLPPNTLSIYHHNSLYLFTSYQYYRTPGVPFDSSTHLPTSILINHTQTPLPYLELVEPVKKENPHSPKAVIFGYFMSYISCWGIGTYLGRVGR